MPRRHRDTGRIRDQFEDGRKNPDRALEEASMGTNRPVSRKMSINGSLPGDLKFLLLNEGLSLRNPFIIGVYQC